MNRRGFLTGIIAAACAPAIIRTPGLIMPIKPVLLDDAWLRVEFTGFTPFYSPSVEYIPPRSIYADLTDVTRRAFVPRMFVNIYGTTPLEGLLQS